MDDDTIVIFDPNSEPFGPLSPNFLKTLEISGENYRSPSHYIYSRLTKKGGIRKTITAQRTARGLREISEQFYKQNMKDTIKKSMEISNGIKFMNPQFRQILLQTGNSQLIYRCEDKTFGLNKKNEGQNLLGKILMSLRDILAQRHVEEINRYAFDNFVMAAYHSYIVYRILEEKIRNGVTDLKEYTTMAYTPDDIITQIGRDTAYRVINYDIFHESLKRGMIPAEIFIETENPGNLVTFLRAQYLPGYIKMFEKRKKHYILELHFKDVIRSKFPLENPDRVVPREIAKLSQEQIEDLENRLYDLYENNILSREIIDQVHDRFPEVPDVNDVDIAQQEANKLLEKHQEKISRGESYTPRPLEYRRPIVQDTPSRPRESEALLEYLKIKIPNYDEVSQERLSEIIGVENVEEMSEEERFKVFNEKTLKMRKELTKYWKNVMSEESKDDYYQLLEGPSSINRPPIIIFTKDPSNSPYDIFSPDYMSMMVVDNLSYPSCSHYILAQMLTNVSYITNLVVAHPYLLIDPETSPRNIENYIPLPTLSDKVYDMIQSDKVNVLKNNSKLALRDKFRNNPQMASLLLATGDKRLIYADSNDSVLGTGPRGEISETNNYIGKYLMELRQEILEAGNIQPAEIKIIPTVELSQILKNSDALQEWFNMRLQDAINSIKTVADYVIPKIDKDGRIDARIVDFVLNHLYRNCIDIYENNAPVYKIPQEFVQAVKNAFQPYTQISRNAVEIIWRYMNYLTARMTEKLESSQTEEDISAVIKDILKQSSDSSRLICNGPFTGQIESRKNCIVLSLKNILKKVFNFLSEQNVYMPIKENEIQMAIKILTPRFEEELILGDNSYLFNPQIDLIKKMMEPFSISKSDIALINMYSSKIIRQTGEELRRTTSRILFFL